MMMMRMLLLLLLSASSCCASYLDFSGLRYKLANSVIDIDTIDISGDDCPSLPCPVFSLPLGCNVSTLSNAALVATLKPWSTMFLATSSGLVPVVSHMLAPAGVSSVVRIVPGSTAALVDYGFQARILLQCPMPCPDGSVLRGTVCVQCSVGEWASSGGVCVPCSNRPFGGFYTSNGIGSSNCSFVCGAGFFPRALPTPDFLVGDQAGIRRISSSTGAVSTLYRSTLSSDATFAFRFLTTVPNETSSLLLGSFSVNLLNVSSGRFVNVAGMISTPFRGAADGVGTLAGFNSIVSAFVVYGEPRLLMVLDASNCRIRRVDLTTRVVATVAGSVCSYLDGVGLNARFWFPFDMVQDPSSDMVYVSENLRIRRMSMADWAVTTVVGNGVGGNVDGVGTLASIDPRGLALDDGFLYVKTIVSIRRIELSTLRVTTLVTFPVAGPFQLARAGPGVLYFASGNEVAAFAVESRQVFSIAGSSSVAGYVDGVGSLARFSTPSLMAVLEDDGGASRLVCMSCPVCNAGSFPLCNTSMARCEACELGKFSLSGAIQCSNCAAGSYGVVGGICVPCGIGSYSFAGSTACTNCSAGTYAVSNQCLSCPFGMYSLPGAIQCSPCTNLIGNATFAGNGTNATNCAVACLYGFTYSSELHFCSKCLVGEWSAAGSTTCSPCIAAPFNSSYVGVGVNATSCPFSCDMGFTSNGTACIPCPAGTRMAVAGICEPCIVGSSSGPASLACTACATGSYSLQGASSCLLCANQGPYTYFAGRGTRFNCPFLCRVGSSVFNNTQCIACTNGTFSSFGATGCTNCPSGTWSGAGASACVACTSLIITAVASNGGDLLPDYQYVSKAGWAVQGVECVMA
jgi:hypothetical protein